MTLSGEYPASDSKNDIFFHTHPTINFIHVRLKLPRTLKKDVDVSKIELNQTILLICMYALSRTITNEKARNVVIIIKIKRIIIP